MKLGDLVKNPPESRSVGPIYNHPMDEILLQVQERQPVLRSSIKLSHVFVCLVFFALYLVVL